MLNITFADLNLPPSPDGNNCTETDHIIVTSVLGRSTLFSANDRYDDVAIVCGTQTPEPIITDSNEVIIKFVTKNPNAEYRGFRLFFNSTKEECGGTIEAESGIIESPGYPGGRDAHRYCEWFITVPKGRRVRADIVDFDVRGGYPFFRMRMRRASSRLAFYYNRFMLSPIRTYMRGNLGNIEPIYSTDNKMVVTLFLADNSGHRGLKLNFSSNDASLCSGGLNGLEGSFTTPQNLSSFYCEYSRTDATAYNEDDPQKGTLGIKISDRTEYPRVCDQNEHYTLGLTASYTSDMYERILYRVCDRNRTDQYVATPFKDTKLVAKQFLGSANDKSFQIDYKIHNCGGQYQISEPVNITMPTFPANYGPLDCAWQFKSDDQKIQLLVSSSQVDCDAEYIQIYNGEAPTSPRVAKICGSSNNNRLFTLLHNMFIEYHTDRYHPSSSFNIQISTQDGICGGEIQTPHYYFSSPKNGTNYPNSVECVWDIKGRAGFHVGVEFTNRFFIENSPNCSKDYVAIFDRQGDNWIQIGKFCGRETPKYVNSTGPQMRVVLHTDGDTAADGFSIIWSENCGGIFKVTNDVKFIESPGYPQRYLSNLNCNYTFIAESDDQININFVDFELESLSLNCEYDNVSIYKPVMYTYPPSIALEGTYCRSGSISRFRAPGKMIVHFRTDRWIVKRGFKFEYSLDRCGGQINQSTLIGSPTSDGDINNVLLDAKCVWNVTAPPNYKIVVRFEMIDLEHNDICYMDFVDIFQGHSTDLANRRARVCGNITDHLPVVNVLSNKAIIKYRTDSSIAGRGFAALVLLTQSCDVFVKLNASNREYTLDRIGVRYDDLLDCNYEFTAPDGYAVKMVFDRFHIATCASGLTNNSCSCDFLEVRDGAGPFSELIGKYCGHQPPPNFTSSSNSLWLRFATGIHITEIDPFIVYEIKQLMNVLNLDASGGSTGFRAVISIEETVCGPRKYTIDDQHSIVEFSIPIHGVNYSSNMNCEWLITTSDFSIVELKFEKFDLQSGDDKGTCAKDYLEITDEDVCNLNLME